MDDRILICDGHNNMLIIDGKTIAINRKHFEHFERFHFDRNSAETLIDTFSEKFDVFPKKTRRKIEIAKKVYNRGSRSIERRFDALRGEIKALNIQKEVFTSANEQLKDEIVMLRKLATDAGLEVPPYIPRPKAKFFNK